MKVRESLRRVRETLRSGGDAETTAWACAAQMDSETLRQLAASWLVESARNAERGNVRRAERESTISVPKRSATDKYVPSPDDQQRFADISNRHLTSMLAAAERFAAEIKMEWTSELLAQTFVVDGETVRWGSATVDQHLARARQFATTAAAAVQGAARHHAAVRDLRAAATATLDELCCASSTESKP